MGNGLLAQWRRGLARRGLAGAALLAVPVAMAAAIGFSGGFGAIADLPGFASGPEADSAADATVKPWPALDQVLVSLTGPSESRPSPAPQGEAVRRAPSGGEQGDGTASLVAPPVAGDPAAPLSDPPEVPLPVDDPGGSVGSLVDGVNQGVNQLLGPGR